VEYWVDRLEGGGAFLLSQTRGLVVQAMAQLGLEVSKHQKEEVHTVPHGVDPNDVQRSKEVVRYTSTGWKNSPKKVAPLDEASERKILLSLAEELRKNYGVKISTNLKLTRVSTGKGSKTRYATVGGSNSDLLGKVMKELGKDVTRFSVSGWRPSRQGAEEMVELLDEQLTKDMVVVFMGLDNGSFYAEDEDGVTSLPWKKDGKYHVEGRVQVANSRQIGNLVGNCEKVWSKMEENKKIIVSPMARYFWKKCCGDSKHCVNHGLPSYQKGMLRDLAEAGEAVRAKCLETGMRAFKVVNPNDLLGLTGDTEGDVLATILGSDPVHPTEAGLVTLAERICKMAEDDKTVYLGEKRAREKEPEMPDGEEIGSQRRKHMEWLFFTVSGEGREGWRGPGRGGRFGGRGGRSREKDRDREDQDRSQERRQDRFYRKGYGKGFRTGPNLY
jgi:hypothetical protein